MQAVNYSHARNNLKSIIDDVCDNNEEVIITTKNGKTVVILSLEEYTRRQNALKSDVKTSLELLASCKTAKDNKAVQRAKLAYGIDNP